jgi:hypothetical protein
MQTSPAGSTHCGHIAPAPVGMPTGNPTTSKASTSISIVTFANRLIVMAPSKRPVELPVYEERWVTTRYRPAWEPALQPIMGDVLSRGSEILRNPELRSFYWVAVAVRGGPGRPSVLVGCPAASAGQMH